MRLNVRSVLDYEFAAPTDVIASVEAATSSDQTILSENLEISPPHALVRDGPDERGERRFRLQAHGAVTMVYEASIDTGTRADINPTLRQQGWSDLPANVFQYLTPSVYCPSDKFTRFAQREFGEIEQGGARVIAVLDWIATHIDYVHGVSDAETTALRTFVDRAGVCRDFTHLGITCCRALNIPARAVSAYAWSLDPPDFHAVFEVFLDNGWWLVDPTRLTPVQGLVRIGTGRDAADIAFLTTSEQCKGVSQCVTVERIADAH